MNGIIKFLVYAILLIVHIFGATIATIGGLVCLVASFACIGVAETKMGAMFLIGALICLGLQKFFIALDPSGMYMEEDW